VPTIDDPPDEFDQLYISHLRRLVAAQRFRKIQEAIILEPTDLEWIWNEMPGGIG